MTVATRSGPALRMSQAAEYTGYAYQTFKKIRSQGEGPVAYRESGMLVFFTDDLDEWMRSRLTLDEHPTAKSSSASAAG